MSDHPGTWRAESNGTAAVLQFVEPGATIASANLEIVVATEPDTTHHELFEALAAKVESIHPAIVAAVAACRADYSDQVGDPVGGSSVKFAVTLTAA